MALITTPRLPYSLISRVTHLHPQVALRCGPHHNTGITLLFNIDGNSLTPTGRTLPCDPHQKTGITLLFNIEGNTFTSTGRTSMWPSSKHGDYPTLFEKRVGSFESPEIAFLKTTKHYISVFYHFIYSFAGTLCHTLPDSVTVTPSVDIQILFQSVVANNHNSLC